MKLKLFAGFEEQQKSFITKKVLDKGVGLWVPLKNCIPL